LSRGAMQVTFIEQSPIVCQQLRHTAEQLKTQQQASIVQAGLPRALAHFKQSVDIIFLDPPFRSSLLQQCVTKLANTTCLHTGSFIYLECNPKLTQIETPSDWHLWRSQQAGQVCYQLWQVDEE
ncbi:MAG: 16S rRNA (guanine(966)-N(2))-methyltransferase RsmD, partial [Legionellales bacterium]|nr:16S rRNA (guanine(966)-N(2))-methyltransferase RsmD [Legionellales bacterium]